jgi:alanine racemase
VGDLDAKPGDPVVVLGAQGGERVTSAELAALDPAVPYEVTCRFSRRLPRFAVG